MKRDPPPSSLLRLEVTVSMARKIVDEKDAQACLVAVARSGETLRAWARRNQIDGRSLHAWQVNLSGRAATRTVPARLVELVPSLPRVSARRYLVRVGDASVEVGDDFAAETLRRILEVIRAC